MRTTTLPDMLRVLATTRRKIETARLFELYVYHPVDGQDLPEEKKLLTLGVYGEGWDSLNLRVSWRN